MSLLFEYKPGMSLTDPWVFTTTRAQTAYFINASGVLELAAANTLRDRHYPFGWANGAPIGPRTTLVEPQVTNFCLKSQALDHATWTRSLLTTVAADATAAPNGTVTADRIVPDATSSTLHYILQALTITANENLAISGFFKTSGYAGLYLRVTDGAGTNHFGATVDVVTGAVTNRTGGGGSVTGSVVVPLANGYVWVGVWGSVGGGVTASNFQALVAPTKAHHDNATAYSGDTVKGIYGWGLQFERFGVAPAVSSPTSYMPTDVAGATRNADLVTTPWPYPTIPQWCYTKAVDLGGSIRGLGLGSGTLMRLTTATPSDPEWIGHFHRNDGKPGASWISDAGPGSVGNKNRNTIAGAGSAPVPYDTVETFSRVLKDGATNFAMRINGGAVAVSSQSGPTATVPFADIATPTLLQIGVFSAGALDGLLVLRAGADPTRITTLDQAANA